MPVLTRFQDFSPDSDKQRVLNHAWLAQGIGTTDFYFVQIDPTTGSFPISVSVTPPVRHKAFNSLIDYSSTAVTSLAWTQIIADTGASIVTQMFIFDGGGNPMVIGIGAMGAEADFFYVAQGGWDNPIEVQVPANSRLSIKSLGPTSNNGYLVIAAFT